jgi:hypothetical protein
MNARSLNPAARSFHGFKWLYTASPSASAPPSVGCDQCESFWPLPDGQQLPELLDAVLAHVATCPGQPPHVIEAERAS